MFSQVQISVVESSVHHASIIAVRKLDGKEIDILDPICDLPGHRSSEGYDDGVPFWVVTDKARVVTARVPHCIEISVFWVASAALATPFQYLRLAAVGCNCDVSNFYCEGLIIIGSADAHNLIIVIPNVSGRQGSQ